jgi:hypothetical protein
MHEQLQCRDCRRRNNDREAYGCVALDSVMERVCIVRISQQVVPRAHQGKKRKASAKEVGASTEKGCMAAHFVLNDLVGAFPKQYMSIRCPGQVLD